MDSDFSTWWTETLPLLEAGESLSGKQWALVRRRVAAFAASLKAPVDDARERNRRDAFVKWWAEFDAAAGDRPTLGEWSAFAGAVSGFVKGKTWAVCPPVNDTSMDLDVENKGDEIVAGVMAPTGDDDETVLDDPVVPETDHTVRFNACVSIRQFDLADMSLAGPTGIARLAGDADKETAESFHFPGIRLLGIKTLPMAKHSSTTHDETLCRGFDYTGNYGQFRLAIRGGQHRNRKSRCRLQSATQICACGCEQGGKGAPK